MSQSKVVILGAGPSGVHLAQLLHKHADVTLVDRYELCRNFALN